MKRKYADRPDWRRIIACSFIAARVEAPAFCGVVSLYSIRRVREPLYKPIAGVQTLLADDGFRWLQLYSDQEASQTYTVTAMYDAQRRLVQWYIDVCSCHGVDLRGVPWHDDLYLDVIASEHGVVEILDAADLEAAVDSQAASLVDYHLAWREAHRLAPMVRGGYLQEMRYAPEALASMVALAAGVSVAGYRALAESQVHQ